MKLQAGKGGDGIISWARNRYNSRMGPSGGNGGNGGTIFFSINKKLSDLSSISKYFWKAENGLPGQKESKTGLSGRDIFIEIPENTEVYDFKTKMKILFNSPTFPICKGGRGGRGNKSFKSAKYQAPQLYELGEKGEEKEILLILSQFKRIGIINLLDSNVNIQNHWENEKKMIYLHIQGIELLDFPVEIFNKEELNNFYSSLLQLCKLFIFIIHYSLLKKLEKLIQFIENKLQEKGFDKFLKVIYIENKNIEKQIKQENNYFFINLLDETSYLSNRITQELSHFEELPYFKNKQIDSEGYIEYSDEIFPEKEKLKILKKNNTWEIYSSALNYWTSRIPQTTWHNLERLKEKMKIEEIMKLIKKEGGVEGEIIKIYNFETTLY